MDSDLARWILEFLLRQPWLVDNRTINSLILLLPLDNNNPSLKKALLLKKIESDVLNGIVSEQILVILEQIEELDHREGIRALDSMKKAYCEVAVECTVRVLEGGGVNKEEKYFDAVKRIWRGRVSEMEKFETGVGLFSKDLKDWRDTIAVGEDILVRSIGVNAVEAVRQYVDEARERMGPSFLEVLAETLSDGTVSELLGWGIDGVRDQLVTNAGKDVVIDGVRDQGRERGPSVVLNAGKNVVTDNGGEDEIHKKRKHVATGRRRIPASIVSRGVKIVDTEELACESRDMYQCVSTPEANRVQESLKSSCLELKAAVQDPLPDALCLAETLKADMARENVVHENAIGKRRRLDAAATSSSADKCADAPQANEGNLGNGLREKNNVHKHSLMERNSTAHVVEWDSVNVSAEASPSRPHLPSPDRRVILPLNKYEIAKLTRRRKPKRWSNLEEDTLRAGVQKYGKGQWKLILNMYRDIFEERIECDLKDKWRNLIRG